MPWCCKEMATVLFVKYSKEQKKKKRKKKLGYYCVTALLWAHRGGKRNEASFSLRGLTQLYLKKVTALTLWCENVIEDSEGVALPCHGHTWESFRGCVREQPAVQTEGTCSSLQPNGDHQRTCYSLHHSSFPSLLLSHSSCTLCLRTGCEVPSKPQGLSCRVLPRVQLKQWVWVVDLLMLEAFCTEELAKYTAVISWVHPLLSWNKCLCSSGRFSSVKSSCLFNNGII